MIQSNDFTLPPLPESVTSGCVPLWDLNNLIHRCCPACGFDEPNSWVVRADSLIISRCNNCSMIYIPDTPSPDEITKVYNSYGEFKGYSGRNLSRFNWLLRSFLNPFVSILEASGGICGKNLLDVGCSYGEFLQLVKQRGAKIHGVELDKHALTHLKKVKIQASSQIPLNSKFDIVCAFQVIEHLMDPNEFVATLSNSLVEDGRILLTLPNGGEADQCGPGWIGFRVDYEHLNYFSSRSLCALLLKNNLFVEKVWEYAHPMITRRTEKSNCFLSKITRCAQFFLQREPDIVKGRFVLAVMARKNTKS